MLFSASLSTAPISSKGKGSPRNIGRMAVESRHGKEVMKSVNASFAGIPDPLLLLTAQGWRPAGVERTGLHFIHGTHPISRARWMLIEP
jgi:hypothetical protein